MAAPHATIRNPFMLLRSITDHVRQQNWFAVWVDFLIVVIGVFVGLHSRDTRPAN